MEIQKKILKKENLSRLLEKIKESKKILLGPKKLKNQIIFDEIKDSSEMEMNYIQTVQSAKGILFPRVEELFKYVYAEGSTSIVDRDIGAIPEVVIFGVRPCDAYGIQSLNALFNWDSKDSFFNERLKKTTVIGVACNKADEYCFCSSVGTGPGSISGSDMLLTRMEDQNYFVEILTEKGKRIGDSVSDLLQAAKGESKEKNLADVKRSFDIKDLTSRLQKSFDDAKFWEEQSLRCLGCGACSYLCPVCACFDIQDEGDMKGGRRLRLWDSCGFSLFTLHTSGHNPREAQNQRWRQRLMHKFSYMPERLSVYGCVGCGRCSRSCPVDMNILDHIKHVVE